MTTKRDEQSVRQSTSKVLVLDDQKGVRELTALFLRDRGLTTMQCASVEGAVERFKEAGGEVDLLIADVTLPDGSGVDAGARLQALKPGIKLLFMSGHALEQWTARDTALFGQLPRESVRTLQKPFSKRDLLDKIGELLDGVQDKVQPELPDPNAPSLAMNPSMCVPISGIEGEQSPVDSVRVRHTSRRKTGRAKDLFLESVSHDLRAPLHTVIGFADLLAEELKGPLNEDQKRYINNILGDSQNLLRMIDDLLDLSRIQAGEFELRWDNFDASQVVEEVVESARHQFEAKDIRVDTDIEEALTLRADQLRFKQILSYLLSHAIRNSRSRGSICIDTACRDGFVEISVRDNPDGISRESREKRKSRASAAAGNRFPDNLVDLVLARELVEQYGGRIWLEEGRGQGSSYTFTVHEGTPPSVRRELAPRDGAVGSAFRQASGL
jgi:CheY-like chemotaxis protein